MDDFNRLLIMNDSRWTNTLKCDIEKNLVEIGEAEQRARFIGLKTALRAEEQHIINLKLDIKKYKRMGNNIKDNYKTKILSSIKDEDLLKMCRNLHPNQIRPKIIRTMYKIDNKSNVLRPKINKKKIMLEKIHKQLASNQGKTTKKNMLDNKSTEVIMAKVADMETKIALVDLNNRKTEKMLDLVRQNLSLYDRLMDQLQNDAEKMAVNIMEEIEIGTFFKEDEANYIQNGKDIKKVMEERMYKDTNRIDHLNAKMDLLERCRKALMRDRPLTEIEKKFYLELPQSLDTYDDLFSDGDIMESVRAKISSIDGLWYNDMSEFGMMHFIDKTEAAQLLKSQENDENADYTYPVNVIDHITVNGTVATKDELAVKYVLEETEFNTMEDFEKAVERTKDDVTKLKTYIALRKILWTLLVTKCNRVQESAEMLKLMTNEDMEFAEHAEAMESFIEEQHKTLSDLDQTSKHYLKSLNELYFYMNNIRIKLKKIKFTVDDIKRYSNFDQTLQDIILETPDKELASYLEELNYIIDEIEAKIRWSGLIITEDLNSEQLNIARALYVYKVQSHIQEYTLNRKQQMENLSKRKLTLNIPLNSQAVIPREETKKQADLIVKYFNEKDLDYSKNKRKPISFRKSFI